MTARKQKQLEKQVAALQAQAAGANKAAEYFRGELLAAQELKAHEEVGKLRQAAGITAKGLEIERQELLARADRLAMRIQGLGFDV